MGPSSHDNWDVVREIVADGFVFHYPIGGTVEAGSDGLVATWAGVNRLSPDSWHPIPILVVEGDYVAGLLPAHGHFTGRSDRAPARTGGRLDYGVVNVGRSNESRTPGDGIRFDMTTCLYHATRSTRGAPELAPLAAGSTTGCTARRRATSTRTARRAWRLSPRATSAPPSPLT